MLERAAHRLGSSAANLLLCVASLLTYGCREGRWVEVEPSPPARSLSWHALSSPIWDLWSPDGTLLWGIEMGGLIVHSADGGTTWTAQSSSAQDRLSDIRGTPDGRIVWAVGSAGIFVRTLDSGKSWTETTLGGKPSLVGIYGSPDGLTLRAFDTNGVQYDSLDGGDSWRRSAEQPLQKIVQAQKQGLPSGLVDIDFSRDGKHLLAVVTRGFLATSDDSGKNWRAYKAPPAPLDATPIRYEGSLDGSGFWVSYSNGSSLYASRAPTETRWQTEAVDLPKNTIVLSGHSRYGRLWLTSLGGYILSRTSSSHDWIRQRTTLSYSWNFVSAEGKNAWLLGASDSGHTLLRLSDEGRARHKRQINREPIAIHSAPGGAWIYEKGGYLAYCNPECTEQKLPLTNQGAEGRIGGTGDRLWIIEGADLLLSRNSGKSWSSERIAGTENLVGFFQSTSGMWALDRKGKLFHMQVTNGEWVPEASIPQSEASRIQGMIGVERTGLATLWAIDTAGSIWRFSQRAGEWRQAFDHGYRLHSISSSSDGQHLWVAGIFGPLFYSPDAGKNWLREPALNLGSSFSSVSVSSDAPMFGLLIPTVQF